MEEILHKYNCHSETDNFFSKMSSQSLAERIATLKGHVFSNANSECGDLDQTNNGQDDKIDLSNNTPPFTLSMLTNSDDEHNQSALRVDSSKPTKDSEGEHAEGDNCGSINARKDSEDILDPGAAQSYSNLALSGTILRGDVDECVVLARQFPDSAHDKLINEDVICFEHSKQLATTPVVVITPAVMEEYDEPIASVDIVNTNGELSAAMLAKDTSDTCSLSSYGSCSENEILTDDEPSDDEMKQPLEDKPDKVSHLCI